MPVIPSDIFKGVADRAAKQAEFFKEASEDARAKGGGLFYPRLHGGLGALGNFPAENDLIRALNTTDNTTFSGTMWTQFYSDLINALETHVQNEGLTNLDAYLNVSGINVHPYFEDLYFVVKNTHLDARNVFEGEFTAPTTLATVEVLSSGVSTFTDNESVGTGSGKVVVGSNQAAATLHVILTSGITPTETVINLQLLQEVYPTGNQAASQNVTIPAGTSAGTKVVVGTSGVNFYLDVTNAVVAGGVTGEIFTVKSERERSIAL